MQEVEGKIAVITGAASGIGRAMARSFGAHGELVESTADFPAAFTRAKAAGKAALIELRVDQDALSPRLRLSDLTNGK